MPSSETGGKVAIICCVLILAAAIEMVGERRNENAVGIETFAAPMETDAGTCWYRSHVERNAKHPRATSNGAHRDVIVGPGEYPPCHGYYENAALSEEGEFQVWKSPFDVFPERHDSLEGRLYKPDSGVAVTVSHGTGKQLQLFPPLDRRAGNRIR